MGKPSQKTGGPTVKGKLNKFEITNKRIQEYSKLYIYLTVFLSNK